jgi:hypothetical protein
MKKLIIQHSGLIAGASLLLITAGIGGAEVHRLSQEQKAIKRDYSIINNVSFGILSVSRWRDLLVDAVGHQIEDLRLTPPERDSLEKEIQKLLNRLIDQADSVLTRPQHSLGGKLRRLAVKALVKPEDLHKQTPAFAHTLLEEVLRRSSRKRLAYVAAKRLETMGAETYDSSREQQETRFDSLFRKYGVQTPEAFNQQTAATLKVLRHRMYLATGVMLVSLAILLLLWWPAWRWQGLHTALYVLSIVMALEFLVTGLTSVMIELDARIDSLNFYLLGQSISFKNQVLFFQSKSIVDVVILLMRNGKYDSILVGLLILCFSILFPMAKLICTGFYLMGGKAWTKSRVVTYFALHSGKWSMADVTVVAIFMAYIGFNGILNDQMNNLNVQTSAFSSIATNRTSLQPGYLVFVSFVLFGLVLSQLLQKMRPKDVTGM